MSILLILLFIAVCGIGLLWLHSTLSALAPLKAELERTSRDLRFQQRKAADLIPSLTAIIIQGAEFDNRFAAQYVALLERGAREGLAGGDLVLALGMAHAPRSHGLSSAKEIVSLCLEIERQVCLRVEAYHAALARYKAATTHSFISFFPPDFFLTESGAVLADAEVRTLPASYLSPLLVKAKKSLDE